MYDSKTTTNTAHAAGYTGKLWFKALRALFAPVRLFLRWKRLLCSDPGEYFRRLSVGCMRLLVFLFFTEAVAMLLAGTYTGAFFFGVCTFVSAYYVAGYDGE